jgi:hypothetical protein
MATPIPETHQLKAKKPTAKTPPLHKNPPFPNEKLPIVGDLAGRYSNFQVGL